MNEFPNRPIDRSDIIKNCLANFDQNDAALQNFICMMMEGQGIMAGSFSEFEKVHGYRLNDEQHPKYLVISDSNERGGAEYTIGKKEKAGEYLSLCMSWPLAEPNGEGYAINSHAADMSTLAWSVKGMRKSYLTRNSANRFTEVVYQINKHGEGFYKNCPPIFKKAAKVFREFYDYAVNGGVEELKKLGIKFNGTEEENIILAMTARQAMLEHKVLQRPSLPEPVLTVQDTQSNISYLWLDHEKEFIKIPAIMLSDHPDISEQDREQIKIQNECVLAPFLEKLPNDTDGLKDHEKWSSVGRILALGAAEKEKKLEVQLFTTKNFETCISTCGDARTHSDLVIGSSSMGQRHNFRNAGNYGTEFVDGEIRLTDPYLFYLCDIKVMEEEFKEKNGLPTEPMISNVKAQHFECGAEGVVSDGNSGEGDNLPTVFKELSLYRKFMYDIAKHNGWIFYNSMGLLPRGINDCMAIQEILECAKLINENPYCPRTEFVIQDVKAARLYVYNDNKFVYMPKVERLEPKQQSRLEI